MYNWIHWYCDYSQCILRILKCRTAFIWASNTKNDRISTPEPPEKLKISSCWEIDEKVTSVTEPLYPHNYVKFSFPDTFAPAIRSRKTQGFGFSTQKYSWLAEKLGNARWTVNLDTARELVKAEAWKIFLHLLRAQTVESTLGTTRNTAEKYNKRKFQGCRA